jgi:sortase A
VSVATAPTRVSPRPSRGDHARTAARGVGQLLITAGIVILLFVAYELWWTGFTTSRDQRALTRTLQRQWAAPLTPAAASQIKNPHLGSGIAFVRIPRLGARYKFVIVQGTSTADLIKGPGHYPGTAMPGGVGNFAVAGHRTTYLHPFYDINRLRVGDPIVIETRTTWFTYTVRDLPGTSARHEEIVAPTDLSVAYPVPDQPDASKRPTQSVLTFTSCNPRYSATQRIVIHALLTQQQPTADGPPPALAG